MKFKLLVATIIFILIGALWYFDIQQYLSLSALQSNQDKFSGYYQQYPFITLSIFFLIYVGLTAVSFPGATFMTLLGGALFGLPTGLLLISFASTIGSSLAFLSSRYLFREQMQKKWGHKLTSLNENIKKDGAFYLFTLRLVPAFPFFLINILMGLTAIPLWRFYWVSQIGMLAGTAVYVNAGVQLSSLETTSDLLSPSLIGAFVLLGLLPWLGRWFVARIQNQRVYKPWKSKKPKHFDYNLLVIGAGSAGLVSAYIAAAVKAKVLLIEKNKMGGDCLNTGCVPSKALLTSAHVAHQFQHARNYGLPDKTVTPTELAQAFPDIMNRVQQIIQQVEPHDSVERYTNLGVECLQGEAVFVSPWEVKVGEKIITARNIIIASGAKPFVPPIPGLSDIDYLTSDSLWSLTDLPPRLIILGGGPIGCELAQAFSRLGSNVIQIEMQERLLIREDPEASALVDESLRADGVKILLKHKAIRFETKNNQKTLYTEHNEQQQQWEFDQVLVAVGRKANTENFNLEKLSIQTTHTGTIACNDYLQTQYPNIYACGDVAGPYQFTHAAAHQAWYASVNVLFGRFKKFKVDYSIIPWATFTDPEVARVGLNETEACEKNIPHEVTVYQLDESDRAITESETSGYIKVITPPNNDRILGVTIVGKNAGDLIAEYVLAMRHGIGLNKILGTIHIYPTRSEANKAIAGLWKKDHAPQTLLKWVKRYHNSQR